MDLQFDKYTYRARLLPSLLTFLPLAFAITVWFPDQGPTWRVIDLILVSSGLATLLSHFGRDFGKRKEADLFRKWGDVPTTLWLSHRFTPFDPVILRRYHAKLMTLVPEVQLPDLASERNNPKNASEVYGACTSFLREKTRDTKTFAVVFAENINYGFRRNLLGWKPVGLVVASCGVLSCGVILLTHFRTRDSAFVVGVAGIGVSMTLLAIWLFAINARWVRLAADAYAERLIRSLDAM